MSDSHASSAGHRPLRDRLLPSWIVSYFARGRASSSAPIASSAIASSTTAAGDDSDGPQHHPRSSSSAVVAASPSTSPSPGKRPGLRERVSDANLYRRLSRASTPSSHRSPPTTTRSHESEPASSALQVPPSSSSTDGTDPDPPTDSLSPPLTATTLEVTAPSIDAEDAMIHTSTASIDIADPMAEVWKEAVAEWQRKTSLDLAVPDAISLRSKEAVMSYIAKMEEEENGSEKSGWGMLRERVDPLAHILEKLCNPIGDTISAAFPPSNTIFAAVGLIVSAYIRTREDFAQIGDAFNEMRFHLQVIETVVGSHPCDVLRTACVLLLTKVLSVLGVIAEMRREGYLRQWLSRISSQTRPLSEALQNLRLLATNQQQAMAAVTLNKLTQLMESIANDKVSQEWIRGCLVDVLRATRELHDLGSSTQAEVIAHRTALRRMELVLYNQSDKLRKIEMFAECEQIKGWLRYVDPSYRLRKLLDDRAEGTGSWFLDGDEFGALKEGKTKAVLLSGKAGSGKSTIIAAAVEALRAYHACDPHSLVLAHVFDSTNASSSQRDLHALLSTLLCQLALNSTHGASIISESRKAIVANGLPTRARMEELLMETFRATSLHITIVVDALDESSDEDAIISFIRRLQAISAISVLASRRPVMDSSQVFGAVVCMDSHSGNNDIELFLDLAMAQGGDLEKVRLDREGVRVKLLAGAEGNFRWVALVSQELKEVTGIPTMVLRRLQSLPSSLRALYQQRLDSIHDDARDDFRRLLLWLVRSEVPLSLHDFAEIMAFDYSHDTPIYCPSHRPLPEAVISMVGSMFISVDGNTVRLAHASVRDFLLGLAPESPFFICKHTDYALMARTVLAYLSAINQFSSLDPDSPLTHTWVYYVQRAGRESYNDLLKEVAPVISKVAAHPIGTATLQYSLVIAAMIHLHLTAAPVDDGGVEVESADIYGQTPLHLALDQGAAQEGHLGIVKLPLAHVASIRAQTNCQSTPLTIAAENGREDVVLLLLESGACAEDCTNGGWAALHYAARAGHLGISRLLLEHGASVNARTKQQYTPLTIAAYYSRENIVRLLLNKGAQVEDRDDMDWTSLHFAAEKGYLSIASLLLAHGASVDARTKQQTTPLIIATCNGREDIIRLLLDKGAQAEDCDEYGSTALHVAAYNGRLTIVSTLLERGASVAARTKEERTPLMIAANQDREDVIRLLLDKGAYIEDRDENDCTALHFAAEKGHLGITLLLLDKGAQVEGRDEDGDTSLHGATWHGHFDIVRTLLERGADANAINNIHHTPLHYAAQNGHAQIAKLLVNRGAVLEARDIDGWTPLYLAVWNCQENVIALLLSLGSDLRTRADDGTTLLDAVGRDPLLLEDTERHTRVRELLMRAGCTEEMGGIPWDDGVLPESARAASS